MMKDELRCLIGAVQHGGGSFSGITVHKSVNVEGIVIAVQL